MNLYGLPQSNRDLIDHQLSIDVGVLMHDDVLECVCMCVHEREKERESEPLNVSVLAWLYSCIYATAICIYVYVKKTKKNTHSLTKNICLCMQMHCILLSSFH